MAERICFIHTVPSLVQRFGSLLRDALPTIDTFHVVDESLLQDLLKSGPRPAITSRIVRHVELAKDAGATTIVFTCSSTSPAVDVARHVVDIPIIKVDDPMALEAVSHGERIGVLCTTSSTVEPSQTLLASHAAAANRNKVTIDVKLVDGAFDALRQGNQDIHDQLVTEAAISLAENCDTIVLAQGSLAHLRDDLEQKLQRRVLSSPKPLMAELVRRFASEAQK